MPWDFALADDVTGVTNPCQTAGQSCGCRCLPHPAVTSSTVVMASGSPLSQAFSSQASLLMASYPASPGLQTRQSGQWGQQTAPGERSGWADVAATSRTSFERDGSHETVTLFAAWHRTHPMMLVFREHSHWSHLKRHSHCSYAPSCRLRTGKQGVSEPAFRKKGQRAWGRRTAQRMGP